MMLNVQECFQESAAITVAWLHSYTVPLMFKLRESGSAAAAQAPLKCDAYQATNATLHATLLNKHKFGLLSL